MKIWSQKAVEMLDHMLQLIPQEINELDWKQGVSSNKERLIEHLSAFANLAGGGYLVFGIEDGTGRILGVEDAFARQTIDKLANLARSGLEPEVSIDHDIVEFRGSPLLIIRIPESSIKPVHRRGKSVEETWIRSGGTTRKASKHDVGGLMLQSRIPRWEELRASLLVNPIQAISQLDYEAIATLLGRPLPARQEATTAWLLEEGFILPHDASGCYVSNLGAIAAARRFSSFTDIARKALRIIHYGGPSKLQTQREILRDEGYATGFETTIELVNALLPSKRLERLIGTLYAPKDFRAMSSAERVEAACQHAELRYLTNSTLTNSSLRERFKVSDRYRAQISRIISEAVSKGRLRIVDTENRSTKFAEYLPAWA